MYLMSNLVVRVVVQCPLPGKNNAVRGCDVLVDACRRCGGFRNLGREQGELQFDIGPSYLRIICRRAEGSATPSMRFIVLASDYGR
jgi:hypothetical protein